MLSNLLSLFSPIKGYFAVAGAAVLAGLIGIWKYRGFKITNLETKLEVKEQELEVVSKSVEAEKDVAMFESANKASKESIDRNKQEDSYDETVRKFTPGTTINI